MKPLRLLPSLLFVLIVGSSLSAEHVVAKEPRFAEGFESDGWWKAWKLGKTPKNCSVVEFAGGKEIAPSGQGKKALRVRVTKDGHYGTSLDYFFKKVDGAEPEEVYFRYYLYLGKNWNYKGKMPGFGGTYGKAGWGGKPSKGELGWSARGQGKTLGDGFQMGTYCYHADMGGKYGNGWNWKGVELKKERWYCIEQYCRMNTPGKKDGVIRAWVDGKEVFEKSDIRMRHNPALKIERIWFNVYYGGKATAPNECFLYLDDIVISNHYIGPRK